MKHSRLPRFFAILTAAALLAGIVPGAASAAAPIRIGAVFPLRTLGPLARQEYQGVAIAARLVNAEGGVHGRAIALVSKELDSPVEAVPLMRGLRTEGITAVLGAYSSSLSIPAAAAAARQRLLYWEAGAVADRLTGQGYATVFRVGASGSNLGSNSANFAATQLAPRLHKPSTHLRLAIVNANDAYATSVADAAIRVARTDRIPIVDHATYNPVAPHWAPVMSGLRRSRPDIIILASHIPDGVSFRRTMIRDHVHTGALIGSTMAECGPEFGAELGREAVGVFASDRPMGGFNPMALRPQARHLYDRLVRAYGKEPTEEVLAGFTAGWVLFHDVLPRAHTLTATGIAAAARSLNLPTGSLPNGAGVRFARDHAHLGQNLRASAVIWQWQAVRHSVVVWPRDYSMGHIEFVPLPR